MMYHALCSYAWLVLSAYSNNNENGEFLTDGITQSSTTNNTFVQCTSTHLTSFAVLVDKSGENVSLSN